MAAKIRKNLWQCTISVTVDLVLIEITFKVFSTALNISMYTNLLDFVSTG